MPSAVLAAGFVAEAFARQGKTFTTSPEQPEGLGLLLERAKLFSTTGGLKTEAAGASEACFFV